MKSSPLVYLLFILLLNITTGDVIFTKSVLSDNVITSTTSEKSGSIILEAGKSNSPVYLGTTPDPVLFYNTVRKKKKNWRLIFFFCSLYLEMEV